MSGLVTLGETMARFIPDRTGPMRYAGTLRVGIAGAESNAAIGYRRLGGEATWIGRVGDDEFGRLITGGLRAEGVRVAATVDPEAPTGLLFKERRTGTATRVLYYRRDSAGSRLSPADLDLAAIADAEVLHVTGITAAISDTALATCWTAIGAARAAGVPVSFDLNDRRSLWSREVARETMLELVAQADVLFATAPEARLLLGETPDDRLLDGLGALGPGEVLLKHGAAGAELLADGERFEAPRYRVTEIDPVGAGDAFAAGYLFERARGAAPAIRLDTAARTGAFAVTVEGDWEGAATVDDLALLESTADVIR